MLDQRRRRWAVVVQVSYKCFVFAGIYRSTMKSQGIKQTFYQYWVDVEDAGPTLEKRSSKLCLDVLYVVYLITSRFDDLAEYRLISVHPAMQHEYSRTNDILKLVYNLVACLDNFVLQTDISRMFYRVAHLAVQLGLFQKCK